MESRLSHRCAHGPEPASFQYSTRSGEMQLNTLTESEEASAGRTTSGCCTGPVPGVCKRLERQFHIKVVILNGTRQEELHGRIPTSTTRWDPSRRSSASRRPFDYELKEETLILK